MKTLAFVLALVSALPAGAAIDVTLSVKSVANRSDTRFGQLIVLSGASVEGSAPAAGTVVIGILDDGSNGEAVNSQSCEKKALLAATNTVKYNLRISSLSTGFSGDQVRFPGLVVFDAFTVTCELIVR